MSQTTSIHTGSEGRPFPLPPTALQPRSRPVHPLYRALKVLASLRLTVFLFVLSLVLVFLGTLAQVDEGIWTVVYKYFRSALVWVPFQVFVRFGQTFFWLDKKLDVPGSFPFPGGWLIGSLLLVNLLAAHAVRFKLSWKRSGILLLHGGLIVMMLGELVTGMFAIEGNLTVSEGQTADFLEIRTDTEVALISHADPRQDYVIAIPGRKLQREKEFLVPANQLDPDQKGNTSLKVEVVRYMPNSTLLGPMEAGDMKNPATAGVGKQVLVQEKPQGAGVDQEAKFDIPAAYVSFSDTKDNKLGTFLLTPWIDLVMKRGQQITVDNKTYDVSLRFKRTYKPYEVQLLKATRRDYPNTNIPSDYSSLVCVKNKKRGSEPDSTVLISMNQPLRYHGETFYQSGMEGKTTILQVVRNPGWLMPYLSCTLVSLGMIIHFLFSLQTFLGRRVGS